MHMDFYHSNHAMAWRVSHSAALLKVNMCHVLIRKWVSEHLKRMNNDNLVSLQSFGSLQHIVNASGNLEIGSSY